MRLLDQRELEQTEPVILRHGDGCAVVQAATRGQRGLRQRRDQTARRVSNISGHYSGLLGPGCIQRSRAPRVADDIRRGAGTAAMSAHFANGEKDETPPSTAVGDAPQRL